MYLCSIYIIENIITRKVYVGQTWNTIANRFIEHCYDGSHCKYLRNAIKKYGKQLFSYKLLTVCGTQDAADFWEQYFIDRYNSTNRKFGYNLKSGGSHGKHSEETKATINKDRIGKKRAPFSEKWKHNMSEAKKNPSDELRRKCGAANKGKTPWNKGTKDMMPIPHNKCKSEIIASILALFNSGLSSGEIGKQLSVDRHTVRDHLTANGVTEADRKPKQSEQQKQKISQSMKGKTNTKGKKWKLVDGKRVYYDPNREK